MKVELDINKGIRFENTNSNLLWDTHKDDVLLIDNPEIDDTKTFIRWKNVKLFGGNILNLSISFDKYENPNDKVEYIRLEDKKHNTPWETYDYYTKLFTSKFGSPNEIGEFQGKPHKIWKFNTVEIILGIGERFIEYSVFVIKKRKPNNK